MAKWFSILTIVFLSGFGCSQAGQSVKPLPKELNFCQTDADCAIADTGACQFPSNKDYIEETRHKYENVECLVRLSNPKAFCKDQRCDMIDLK